ncbi:hypothetical protein BVC80_9099g5 [Macleaya cordata]|uniref:Uncharacterized protein n=1 Tax=Macleaya cordata TaxID=56857 RepID=A0A200PVI4_MACCD|nr:hypothetical protein BVC80_9099g5 [Macleaya cordata]
MEAYWKYLKKSKFKIIDIGGSRLIWRDGFRENGGNNITRGQTVARGLRAGRRGNPRDAPQGHPQEAPQGNPPSSVTEQMHKIEHDVQQVWGTWVPGNDVPSSS